MSNETQQSIDKNKPPGKPPPVPQAIKLPQDMVAFGVQHLFFTEHADVAGESQISNLKTFQKPGHQRFYTARVIPALQVVELTYVHAAGAEEKVQYFPMCHIKRFEHVCTCPLTT